MTKLTISPYMQSQIHQLRAKGVSIRKVAELLEVDRGVVQRFDLKSRAQAQAQEPIGPSNLDDPFLDKLKGSDFPQWNKVIGMPVKQGRGSLPFPYPYEWTVFNSLIQEDGSPKDRHVAWLASRGIGKSETAIRILSWLATRDDAPRGSEMMLITGNRQALANDLIRRIKLLFKEAYLPETAANVVELNGVHIESYPASGHTAAGRGKSFVSAIFLDESSWWGKSNPVETQGILDVVTGYWVKSNPWTLFASSPSQPGDLMDMIFQEKEDECVWRRIKQDWRYGENLIYTQSDLARIRRTSSWKREMELGWSPKSGSTFLQSDIERARCEYDLNHMDETTIAVDPASSTTGICVTEARDGDIYVLRAEEVTRAMHETLADYVYELYHQYAPVSKLYIDNSAVTFCKTMKQIIGEPVEYMDQIKTFRSQHVKYELNMRVEPVFFTQTNKSEMLGMLQQVLQEGHLKIHPRFDKLLLFLHSATDTELIIDKQSTPHNDVGDALQMCLKNYTK